MRPKIKTAVITLVMLFTTLFTTVNSINAQTTSEKMYVKMEVDGLSCPFCVYGLEKKIKQIKSANDVVIELEAGEVTFNVLKEQELTKEKLQKIVKNAGFTAKEISFSEIPFKPTINE